MPAYLLDATDAYLVQMVERHRAQSRGRFGRRAVKVICFIGLCAIFAIGVFAKVPLVSGFIGIFIVLLLVGPRFDYWLMKRNFHKSPYYLKKTRIDIGTDGFRASSDLSKTDFTWRAFTKATRLDDGILLMSGTQPISWLPDAALVEGNIEEVKEIMRKQVATYVGA